MLALFAKFNVERSALQVLPLHLAASVRARYGDARHTGGQWQQRSKKLLLAEKYAYV